MRKQYKIIPVEELAKKLAQKAVQELGRQLVRNNQSKLVIRQIERLNQLRKEKNHE